MEIGLIAPFVSPLATPEYVSNYGQVAEACGFDSLWLAEHVVLFDESASRYPYAEDGRVPAGGENGFLETFTALAFLAAKTSRIRLGTGVCLVPQRNPVYTAKEAAAVDWLSDGRLDFGVGVGWQAEEFRAVAAPFERRGARCRAFIDVIKSLWMEPISSCENDFYSLEPCRLYPKPVQTPHPPIYFGGESAPALRRVAEQGQGWFGLGVDPEDLPPLLAQLDRLLGDVGRTRREIKVSASPYFKGCDADKLARYEDAGVDQVLVPGLAMTREAIRPTLEELAVALL